VAGGIERDLWSPADVADDEQLPLLVVHDGPEYDKRAGLTGYLAAGITAGRLPRLRALLLSPTLLSPTGLSRGDRNRNYSASTRYLHALIKCVPPAPVRIGMGTSLGALAMLHAHSYCPLLFDALFLQSGSFFTPLSDPQERRFPYYSDVVAYTTAPRLTRPIPVMLTCGADEENLANNRLMTGVLRGHGYPATLHEVPGGHDWASWRAAFDPYLDELLRQACP
jgi:enterochelin esterase-like enzyme